VRKLSVPKKIVVSAVAAAVGLTLGAAYAMWSADGTGSGSASALTAETVVVNASTGAADLYPGFADGDVHFTLTNDNPYPVTFTASTAGDVTSSNPSGCPASNLTVDAARGLTLTVAAGRTSGEQSIADVVTLDGDAPDACQGVTFTVALTLTGTQV
jgi:hypothetical protein